ncbi:MAG: GNAT family N-acetyltransferase, partial [Clostridia bacterium]
DRPNRWLLLFMAEFIPNSHTYHKRVSLLVGDKDTIPHQSWNSYRIPYAFAKKRLDKLWGTGYNKLKDSARWIGLQIYHPQAAMNGAPPENIFLAIDDAGQRCGCAVVVEYVNHTLLPDRPLNYYISLDGYARARDMLLGAALARALFLRREYPKLRARIYTPCSPRDQERLRYFTEAGFVNDDAELVLRWILQEDQAPAKPPVGCMILPTPLHTAAQREALMRRCAPYFATIHTVEWLEKMQRETFFAAFGMLQENELLGEMIVTGYGVEGCVQMIYTVPRYRRRGVARALLEHARAVMIKQALRSMTFSVWQRNHPAAYLCQSTGFVLATQTVLYPGVNV